VGGICDDVGHAPEADARLLAGMTTHIGRCVEKAVGYGEPREPDGDGQRRRLTSRAVSLPRAQRIVFVLLRQCLPAGSRLSDVPLVAPITPSVPLASWPAVYPGKDGKLTEEKLLAASRLDGHNANGIAE